MQINEIIDKLSSEFPSSSILEGDKVGLQVSSTKSEIKKVFVAYELTDDVVIEATEYGADLIISFHPLIYYPLVNLNDDDRVGRIIRQLILNDISLYVIHTNFDTHSDGTNSIIADKLKLTNRKNFVQSDEGKNNQIGIIGNLPLAMSTEELAELLSVEFNSPVKYCTGKAKNISEIAVLGGSGSSFINNALNSQIDAYITADVTYHSFHQCKGRLALFDLGHYEMEQFNPLQMKSIICNLFYNEDIEFIDSKTNTNPVNYYLLSEQIVNKHSNNFKKLNNGDY